MHAIAGDGTPTRPNGRQSRGLRAVDRRASDMTWGRPGREDRSWPDAAAFPTGEWAADAWRTRIDRAVWGWPDHVRPTTPGARDTRPGG